MKHGITSHTKSWMVYLPPRNYWSIGDNLLPFIACRAATTDTFNHLESHEFLERLIYRRARHSSRESDFAWSRSASLRDVLPHKLLLRREKLFSLCMSE